MKIANSMKPQQGIAVKRQWFFKPAIGASILILIVIIWFHLPPILVHSDGITIGRTKLINGFGDFRRHSANKFENLYIVNFGINDEVKIYRDSVDEGVKPAFKQICPFIWSEKTDDSMVSLFIVEINEKNYYFCYLTP